MLATKPVFQLKLQQVEQQTPPGRRPERARQGQGHALARFAVYLFFAVAAALAVAGTSARVARQGQDLVALKEELRVLEADNRRLEAEMLGLQSLARIEHEAKRLGLDRPRVVRPVPFVPAPPFPPVETLAEGKPAGGAGAARDEGPVEAGVLSGPGLKSAAAALDRLAERVSRWLAGD